METARFSLVRFTVFFCAAFLFLALASSARADCTPANDLVGPHSRADWVQGGMVYDLTNNVLKTCDGTNWNTVGTGTPAGTIAGAVQFRGSSSIFLADDANLIWNNTTKSLGVGTATPAASSVLDLTSTAKGFLPPRMTSAQRDLIGSPATGLTIFNTTNSQLEFYNGTSWNGIGSMTAGTISAFAATSCPSGWTEYTAARGRFLRGIDSSGSTAVDPSGTRAPGNQQADAFQGHFHGSSAMGSANTRPVGGGVQETATTGSATGAPIADGTNGTPRTSSETRPVNVAVIFCQFIGSGNVAATATVTGTTNYVAKFTGPQAVGNSQIFDNGTRVGIGTTSPRGRLDIIGQSDAQWPVIIDPSYDIGGGGYRLIAFYTAGTYRADIYWNGSSIIYGTGSDYRLKEHIRPMASALQRLANLPVYQFNMKDNTRKDLVEGFLAHEVQGVAPYAVSGKKDEVDANGRPVYQMVDYGKLTPLLVKAVQELKEDNENLRAELDELRREIAE